MAAAQAGNTQAGDLVHRYQHRPEIEWYDVEADPYEMNNLADDPNYQAVKVKLRKQLDQWMKRCGDKGQATELRALDHTTNGRTR